jgi:succinyl-diaminopimelate desuccinylase|tara:strand:- start:50121 stop:51290 length:1170 start_codon:yes stop_codon:yes gene_type:complete
VYKLSLENTLKSFIQCESITPNAKQALDFIEKILSESDFYIKRLTFNSEDTYPVDNLYASFGKGSPHLCFAGHVDVVPYGDISQWSCVPFEGETKNGRIYGRGAEDMKGSIIAWIFAMLEHIKDKKNFKGTISILLTGDEEGLAINGTTKVLEWLKNNNINIDSCIVGEPTNIKAVGDTIKVGRRGSLSCELKVNGEQGHVAYPDKASSPIPVLIKLLDKLINTPIDSGNDNFIASNLEVTSIDIGNEAMNIIPSEAQAVFNIRYNNLWDETSLFSWLYDKLNDVSLDSFKDINWNLTIKSSANSFLTKEGKFSSLILDSIFKITGLKANISTGGGTSDARFISQYCPVVEFGLVGRTMHQVDENISLDELKQLKSIYQHSIVNYFENF